MAEKQRLLTVEYELATNSHKRIPSLVPCYHTRGMIPSSLPADSKGSVECALM